MEKMNNEQMESGAEMGFTISRWVKEQVEALVLTITPEQDVISIPGAHGAVLVRENSQAYRDRESKNPNVIKIPMELKTVVQGVEVMETFFVCTQ